MIAYRLVEPQQPPQLQRVPIPEPKSGQILIKVGGCGLCHTDLGFMRRTAAQWGDTPPPFTLGHEVAGWVESVGGGVVGFDVGEPVAVLPLWGTCGHCAHCRRGEESFCLHVKGMTGAGAGFDGGLAEYVVVESRFVVPTDGLDPLLAAPLTDAGLTTYTAIKPVLPVLGPGTTSAVIGVGGLGLLGVQFLRALSATRVIAVDTDATRLNLAKEHGADVGLLSDRNTAASLRELTQGAGVTFVLDCVGNEPTLKTGIAALARLGRLTLVGAALKTVPFGLHEVPWGAQLATSLSGGSVNLREVIALVREGHVESVEDRYPLSRVADAYKALEAGTLRGRAVCVPDGEGAVGD